MKERLRKIIKTKIMPSIKPDQGEMIDSVRVRIGENDRYLQEAATGKQIYTKAEYKMLKMNEQELENCKLIVKDGKFYYNKDQSTLVSTFGLSSKGENNTQAFVMDKDGSLYIATHDGFLDPDSNKANLSHASFLSGRPAEMAGTITILGGKIAKITNKSGHYQPDALDMYRGIKRLGNDVFCPNCKIFIGKQEKTLNEFIREMETHGSSGKMRHEELRERRVQEFEDKILLFKDTKLAIDKFVKSGADENKLIDLFVYCVDGNRTREMQYFFSKLKSFGQLDKFINMDLDEDGITPLRYLVYKGNGEMAKVLLDNGADLEGNLEGKTVLEQATDMYMYYSSKNPSNLQEKERLKGVIFTLVENGANIDNVKDSPIIEEIVAEREKVKEVIALAGDKEQIVKALDGLDGEVLAKVLNYRDEKGNSLLHIAAERGNVALCEKLIEKGADVFASNNNGKTSLNLAREKPVGMFYQALNYFRGEKYPAKQDMAEICNKLVEKEKEIEEIKLGKNLDKIKSSAAIYAPSKTPYSQKLKNFFYRGV